jgi:hypothetical protein
MFIIFPSFVILISPPPLTGAHDSEHFDMLALISVSKRATRSQWWFSVSLEVHIQLNVFCFYNIFEDGEIYKNMYWISNKKIKKR